MFTPRAVRSSMSHSPARGVRVIQPYILLLLSLLALLFCSPPTAAQSDAAVDAYDVEGSVRVPGGSPSHTRLVLTGANQTQFITSLQPHGHFVMSAAPTTLRRTHSITHSPPPSTLLTFSRSSPQSRRPCRPLRARGAQRPLHLPLGQPHPTTPSSPLHLSTIPSPPHHLPHSPFSPPLPSRSPSTASTSAA